MKRLLLLVLVAVVSTTSVDAQNVKRKLQKESYKFKWYLLKQGDYRGAESEDGRVLIPIDEHYNDVNYHKQGYFTAYKFGEMKDGQFVKPYRRHNPISVLWKGIWVLIPNRAKDSVVTIYDISGRMLVSANRGYRMAKYHYNGFWIVRDQNGWWGLCDTNGRELCAPNAHYKWNNMYFRHGYFNLAIDNAFGVLDTNFREIISADRGYTNVSTGSNNTVTYFVFVKDGQKGICDLSGKEIVTGLNNSYGISYVNDCFYYYTGLASTSQKYYLGVGLDSLGHGVPNLEYHLGRVGEPDEMEQTAYNSSYSNTYNNSYNSTYNNSYNNNSYTPPTQRKQTSVPQKSATQTRNNDKAPQAKSASSSSSSNASSLSSKKKPRKNNASSFQPKQKSKCGNCSGRGYLKCYRCSGKGTITQSKADNKGRIHQYQANCPACHGKGSSGKCTRCNGTGMY